MARRSFSAILVMVTIFLSGCLPVNPPSKLIPTRFSSASAAASPTTARAPAVTFTLAFTRMPTLPALPGPYQTARLNPLDTPHTYIREPCRYLFDKWSSANSAPGTVVMVIMFHAITDATLTDPNQISEYNYRQLMMSLHPNGFQAITTLQLDGFLENNSKIPGRSVLLVTDDKHTAAYFNVLFRQYWIGYAWPVVNAWVSDDLTTSELWKEQEELNSEGWVDYQAHGVVSSPITRDSSDDYILGELKGSIDVFQAHFHKTPIAFIWPGGGFTAHSVALARQSGYRLGFTTNPRGPLMFNWVPLADSGDPARPTWIPEGAVNDPLMVLPRYWDTDAAAHLEDVIQTGLEAATYAQANKPAEMHYYNNVCLKVYGAIP